VIKVNLLRSKAVASYSADGAESPDAAAGVGGFSNADVYSNVDLGGNVSTFEYGQVGQLLKLLLIVGFIAPLIVFERIRSEQNREYIANKSAELRSLQTINAQKQQELTKFTGLENKRTFYASLENEVQELTNKRLVPVKSLDAIQSAVPFDVWLTSIVVSEDLIQLNGQTIIDDGLDTFVANLKNVRSFTDIGIPKDVKVKSKNGKVLNEFLVTLKTGDLSSDYEEGGAF
jgi:hypothetical protein